MSFLEFQNRFSNYPLISTVEIKKQFPGFDSNALTRWQQKEYLEKIRNGYYRFPEHPTIDANYLFFTANHIYRPSYVSLFSALRWYDFIPEGVFTVTSVGTRKTKVFSTPLGHFSFKKIKRELFFGYTLQSFNAYHIKMASPEKAILDVLYLYPHLRSEADFAGLRLNLFEIRNALDGKKLTEYLELFKMRSLEKRTKVFLKFMHNHDGVV